MRGGILLCLGFLLLTFVFLQLPSYVSYCEVHNRNKQFIHFIGFLSGFLFSLGFLCKLQHWPFGNELLLLSIGITCLIFLPVWLIPHIKNAGSKMVKVALLLALIGTIIYLVGFYFKQNHYPGSMVLLLTGILLLGLFSVPILLFHHFKTASLLPPSFVVYAFIFIWFIVPISMLSTYTQEDTYRFLKWSDQNDNLQLTYLLDQHNQYVSNLQKLPLPSPSPENSSLSAVIQQSDSMYRYFQSFKWRLLYDSEIPDNLSNKVLSIDESSLPIEDIGPVAKVFADDHELLSIQQKISRYQKFLDSLSKQCTWQDRLNSWKHPSLNVADLFHENCSLLFAFNRLTQLQETVLITENCFVQNFKSSTK